MRMKCRPAAPGVVGASGSNGALVWLCWSWQTEQASSPPLITPSSAGLVGALMSGRT
jgi:hypothetical protein